MTLQLETDSAVRALRSAIADREQQLVQHDVLKLQVHRLRQLLSMATDEVYDLETRKSRLALSLDERRTEIELHRDGLRTELKLLRDDVHRCISIICSTGAECLDTRLAALRLRVILTCNVHAHCTTLQLC